jgi:nucleoside-diphosphate-sugar epimerase
MLDFIRREFNYSLVLKIPYPVLLLTAFLAKLVADLTGNRPLITPRELSSVRKHYWIHDVTLIKKELGFSPEIKFEAGLNKIINWYRQNGYF